MKKDFKIQIFADGADKEKMLDQYKSGLVQGFTTNPSLMKRAGVSDYTSFAKELVSAIPDRSISFEVFADDLEGMEREAKIIAGLGPNVFVKIPIVSTKGEYMLPLIERLSAAGVNLNITAVFTIEQTKKIVQAVNPKAKSYVSIFAGRLADNGYDPIEVMKEAVDICHSKDNVFLLWASTREVWNVFEAESLGVDIITVPDSVLQKLPRLREKTSDDLSIDTVVGFQEDIAKLGFSIE